MQSSLLHAQVAPRLRQSPPDSLRGKMIDSTEVIKNLSTKNAPRDSLKKSLADTAAVPQFALPHIGFRMDTAAMSTHFFQDFLHLAEQTVPLIPLRTGEVGLPRYWAAGDLPARAIQVFVDEAHWLPGVYGAVDLTSLPDANVQNLEAGEASLQNLSLITSPSHIYLSRDTKNFNVPFSRLEYAKGPFGADAVRFRFGRALGKRLAADLNGTFSNTDGQFQDRPYDGRKLGARFDYLWNAKWRWRYQHFNSRHQAGIVIPFFPEEWDSLGNAAHKEERFYHGLTLSSTPLSWRGYYWQTKEEFSDPTLRQRHCQRDIGMEMNWQRNAADNALLLQSRVGLEQIRSTSIRHADRIYAQLAATFARRFSASTWLQANSHMTLKNNWPASGALTATLIRDLDTSSRIWWRASYWKIPPSLGERDNALIYLGRNNRLHAVDLLRNELGLNWQRSRFDLQLAVSGSFWKNNLVYRTNDAGTAGYLSHTDHRRFILATQFNLNWEIFSRWQVRALAAQALNGLPKDFWFWHQPEGHARLSFETLQSFFKGDLEVLPRLVGRLVGKSYSPDFSPAVASSNKLQLFARDLPATAVVDFQIRVRHGDGALMFSWENILNRSYDLRSGIPAVGRYLRWGFWWNFLN